MLDLQDITIQYLSQKFQPELLSVVLDACTVLQKFTLGNYEHDLIDLITRAEDLDSSDVRDRFVQRIQAEMVALLAEHFINVDEDAEPSLKELTEVGLFLLLLQNLENTEQVAYRVYGFGSGRTILVDLMSVYSTLPRIRVMEILSRVDDRLILAIQAMVGDRQEEVNAEDHQRQLWQKFYAFISATDCLGGRLHKEGYFGLSLDEMMQLSRFNVQEYLSESVQVRPAQAALDVLSLLYLCRDTYQVPLLGLDKNSLELFYDSDAAGRVRAAVSSILNDFSSWLEAQKPGLAEGKGVIA